MNKPTLNTSAYIFTSERLGFRNWIASDIKKMAEINSNPDVMEFFPSIQTYEQTRLFIEKMQQSFAKSGFCYFAVEKLENAELIGFIGLAEQNFAADFTPCIDIGWRLDTKAWYAGYATEGAKACLKYAFNVLKLEKILAMAPVLNTKSIHVMEKIGMQKIAYFENHPYLLNDERLKKCVLYEINNQSSNLL